VSVLLQGKAQHVAGTHRRAALVGRRGRRDEWPLLLLLLTTTSLAAEAALLMLLLAAAIARPVLLLLLLRHSARANQGQASRGLGVSTQSSWRCCQQRAGACSA
jgi:hypothetical protein